MLLLYCSAQEYFNKFYWSIIDLQGCASFRCIAKWFNYIYMLSFRLFSIIGCYTTLNQLLASSLRYTGLCCLFYVYQCVPANPFWSRQQDELEKTEKFITRGSDQHTVKTYFQ